mgnify:CR=1 FL=1
MELRKDIRKLQQSELLNALKSMNEPGFRAQQVWDWLWQKRVTRFEDMRNLPLLLRQKLEQAFVINAVHIHETQSSADGTLKCAMRLHDQYVVESVLIPQGKRMTACISSQVGCSLTCSFCATGKLKRMRNLQADEIYDQVMLVNETALNTYQQKLSNIVFMGMGEPLLNYNQVKEAITKLCAPEGMGLSPQRITVSTAGVHKMIRTLADDRLNVHLALSLHAASDEKRNQVMPINETNSLAMLKEALVYFYTTNGRRPTLEYVMLNGFNDSLEDARRLLTWSRGLKTKVNLIEYNPVADTGFTPSSNNRMHAFAAFLNEHGLVCTIRKSRGKDIDAACGQLANHNSLAQPEYK